MGTIKRFVHKHGIKINCDYSSGNPNMPDWRDANHYKVRLIRGKKQLTTYFSQGYGIPGEPDAEGVLNCLFSDSISVENCASFEDWCSDLGYDSDSRKAERIFKVCEKQAEKLKGFLGEDLYHELLYRTETL